MTEMSVISGTALPIGWKHIPLKYNLRRLSEKSRKGGVVVALENIENWTGRIIETESAFDGDGVDFKRGDILFGKLRPYLAKVYLAESDGEAVGDLWVLRPQDHIEPRFATYKLLESGFIDRVNGSTTGAKMPRAEWGFVGSIQVPTPPLEEQTAIARFLDRETARIDGLIEKKQRFIALLKEKRATVITHAVTGGIDPAAPMKGSGVDSPGRVSEIMLQHAPSDWQRKRLGQLFRERREKVSDKDFPPLSVTKQGILPQLDTAAKTDDGDNRKGVRVGDFVINSRSDRKGSGGLSDRDGSVSLINIVLQPRDVEPRFTHHLLRSPAFQEEFYRWGHGIVADLWTTRYSEMKNILLAVPDRSTQTAIARFLDRETARIDGLTTLTERSIDLLREKRAALITAAVTGQIDMATRGKQGRTDRRLDKTGEAMRA